MAIPRVPLPEMSPGVDYPRLNYEHSFSANSPPLQKKKYVIWSEIEKELRILDEILKLKDKTPEDPPWVFPR